MLILLWGLGAWAAGAEEVTVWGDRDVEAARQQVVEDLQILGYNRIKRRGDTLILKHEKNWKGTVLLHDDGYVTLRRQAPRVQRPPTQLPGATAELAWFSCAVIPTQCFRVGGIVVSGRKLDQQKGRARRAISSDLLTLGDRLADREIERQLEVLPDRLQRLWTEGVPLEGDVLLESMEARRRALLDYWASRTETGWGERVREAVEAFLRAEVQSTEHAMGAADLDAFNRDSRASRPLTLPVGG